MEYYLLPRITQWWLNTFIGWTTTMRTLAGAHVKDVPPQFNWVAFLYLFYPNEVAKMIDFLDANTSMDEQHNLRCYLELLPPEERAFIKRLVEGSHLSTYARKSTDS
jgi:hypothetical protein